MNNELKDLQHKVPMLITGDYYLEFKKMYNNIISVNKKEDLDIIENRNLYVLDISNIRDYSFIIEFISKHKNIIFISKKDCSYNLLGYLNKVLVKYSCKSSLLTPIQAINMIKDNQIEISDNDLFCSENSSSLYFIQKDIQNMSSKNKIIQLIGDIYENQ